MEPCKMRLHPFHHSLVLNQGILQSDALRRIGIASTEEGGIGGVH